MTDILDDANLSDVVKSLLSHLHTPYLKLALMDRSFLDNYQHSARLLINSMAEVGGRWVGVSLSSDDFRQLWVPPGYLHGFVVMSETAEVEYKCTDVYDAGHELGVAWNDPEIGIEWPLDDPILSAKDAAAPRLAEVQDRLPVFEG